ncbi:MAG: hypothetical protein IPI60_19770 [Saprospiraceae bacterium]|nr:hypothetical protein [Saprospiraceae bacterium]
MEQGISPSDIFIINETPFSSALHKSYEIGIEQGKKWTLCVDADVLLRSGIISQIVHLADKMPEHVFETQGMILDYLFGGPREGGIHLYRSNLLPKALDFIAEAKEVIRPESYILHKMKALGYPFQRLNLIVGLHDYEQYYKDIFRKCFVHAPKHLRHLPYLIPFWQEMSAESQDYEVAIAGLCAGLEYQNVVTIDALNHNIINQFEQRGLSEKNRVDLTWTALLVEETIKTRTVNKNYYLHFPENPNYLYDVEKFNWYINVKRSLWSIPIEKRPAWFVGKVLKRISRKLLNE